MDSFKAYDTSSADVLAADVDSGLTAYGKNGKITGGGSDPSGASNKLSERIRKFVTDDATATAANILEGKIAFISGGRVVGTKPVTPFLANFDADHTGADCVNYVPDVGYVGVGSSSGIVFNIASDTSAVEIGSQSGNEQGLIWPHNDFGTNYDVEYRVCVFINTAQGGQYLQFDSSNANADDAIIFGLSNGNANLWVTGSGSGSGTISNSYTFVDNNATWYTIKCEVRGNDLELFVDNEGGGGYVSQGTLTVSGRTLGQAANRKLGPRTWYTTGGYSGMPIYDWIKVTAR